MEKDARFLVLGASLFLIAIGTLAGSRLFAQSARDSALPTMPIAHVARVERMMVSDPILATGTTQPDHETVLSFKTAGVIRSISVNAGDRVTRGEVLAELDPRDLDAALKQAANAHDRAVRDLARYESLHKDGFVAESTYDDARTQESTTRAAALAAEANRAYGQLVAPNDGTVLARAADPAAVVNVGAPILTLSNETLSDVLKTGITDRDVLNLALGDPAEIRFAAYPARVFRAAVSEIGRQADPRTGVFEVKLAIADGQGRLPAGLIGEARITPASHARSVTAIPVAALLEANGSDGEVVVADGGRAIAHHRHVRLGDMFDKAIEISTGLRPGEYVVTDGAVWLDEGEPFAIVR